MHIKIYIKFHILTSTGIKILFYKKKKVLRIVYERNKLKVLKLIVIKK